MSCTDISFTVYSSKAAEDIRLSAYVDGNLFGQVVASTTTQTLHTTIDCADHGGHALELVMSGKTPAHTKIYQNKIVDDVLIHIDKFQFDGVHVDHLVHKCARYHHDQPTDGCFYGIMGCNGTVRLRFTIPIHMWLLKHT
jgi:hypothetical protein